MKKKEQSKGKNNAARKKRSGKVAYVLTSLLGVVVILLSVAYGIFHHYYSKLNTDNISYGPDDYEISETDLKISESDLQLLNETLYEDLGDGLEFDEKNVTNILLIGTDGRVGGNKRTRSDAIIAVSINRNTKKVIMTSFLRDMYVSIPTGEDYQNRINTAFAIGGPDLLFSTLKKNFGIKVDKYVHIDFFNFMELVDAVGGVDIEVDQAELNVINLYYLQQLNAALGLPIDTDFINSSGGLVHMNGKQALCYTRIRYVGQGDFERTERQRKVLSLIVDKVKTLNVSELNKLADVILPLIATNLTQGEVMSLIVNSPEYLSYDLESYRIPIDHSYSYIHTESGAAVLGVNFRMNKNFWYNTVYGEGN